MADVRRELAAAGIGLLVGVIGTGLTVWRDMAVMKVDMAHVKSDIEQIQRFIASDDPLIFKDAQEQIRKDRREAGHE